MQSNTDTEVKSAAAENQKNFLVDCVIMAGELDDGGDIINVQNRDMRGYGKPFGDWKWSYEPTTDNPKKGGAW